MLAGTVATLKKLNLVKLNSRNFSRVLIVMISFFYSYSIFSDFHNPSDQVQRWISHFMPMFLFGALASINLKIIAKISLLGKSFLFILIGALTVVSINVNQYTNVRSPIPIFLIACPIALTIGHFSFKFVESPWIKKR